MFIQIYNRLDFQNFIDAMHEIFIDAEAFFREYEKKFGYKKSSLIDRYNDVRLVRCLRSNKTNGECGAGLNASSFFVPSWLSG